MSKWISVKKRLPEDHKYVLCVYKNCLPFIGLYGVWVENAFTTAIDREVVHPTHWMPLPEPPMNEDDV